jgi:hypothetical protein
MHPLRIGREIRPTAESGVSEAKTTPFVPGNNSGVLIPAVM